MTDEAAISALFEQAEGELGPVDLFVSNAGISPKPVREDNDHWHQQWNVHVMAHLFAARAVAPRMAARGGGKLVNVKPQNLLLRPVPATDGPMPADGRAAMVDGT